MRSIRDRLVLGAFGGLALLMVAGTPASADKCTATKLKLVAKKEQGLVTCHAKVAVKGDPTLLGPCMQKVDAKYAAGFPKAGSCGGDQALCECIAESCATAVRADLADGGPSKCESLRLEAAAKKAAAKLVCNAKATAKGVAVDALCIQKAEAKYQAAFAKTTGCSGDQSTVETDVDQQCVTAVGADATGGSSVGTLCGSCSGVTTSTTTTTTTTTVVSTTTTTTIPTLCCDMVGGCFDSPPATAATACAFFSGTLETAGQVCDGGTGTCQASDTGTGGCCQGPGVCFEGPRAEGLCTFLGGTFLNPADCGVDGTCVLCGTFVTAFGGPGSSNGQFFGPFGLATDGSGNVYVVDQGNDRIQKFDTNGTFLTTWGTEGSGPTGVATDASGHVYVTEIVNNRIQKFDANGTFLATWGTEGSGNGQFEAPFGVATDASGNVYVADTNNNRIQKFDANGTFLGKWGSLGSGNGQFNDPTGVAVDPNGNVFVVDTDTHRVQKFSNDGTFLATWGSHGSGNGQFSFPTGVATDASGHVYVVDQSNRIQKFDTNGMFLATWGTEGSGNGQFENPVGVATDASGHVYVADQDNNRIQEFVCP